MHTWRDTPGVLFNSRPPPQVLDTTVVFLWLSLTSNHLILRYTDWLSNASSLPPDHPHVHRGPIPNIVAALCLPGPTAAESSGFLGIRHPTRASLTTLLPKLSSPTRLVSLSLFSMHEAVSHRSQPSLRLALRVRDLGLRSRLVPSARPTGSGRRQLRAPVVAGSGLGQPPQASTKERQMTHFRSLIPQIVWQMYWPNWWHLIPHHAKTWDKDFQIHSHVFCFGPFQCHWYGK